MTMSEIQIQSTSTTKAKSPANGFEIFYSSTTETESKTVIWKQEQHQTRHHGAVYVTCSHVASHVVSWRPDAPLVTECPFRWMESSLNRVLSDQMTTLAGHTHRWRHFHWPMANGRRGQWDL